MNHFRKYLKLYLVVFLLTGFVPDDMAALCAHISHEELELYSSDHDLSNRCTPHSEHQCNPLHEISRHEQMARAVVLQDNAIFTTVSIITGGCARKRISSEAWNDFFVRGRNYRLLINSSLLI